jgi:chromosomal replication initiation ATPase DnaA
MDRRTPIRRTTETLLPWSNAPLIIQCVADFYHTTPLKLRSKDRSGRVSWQRHVCIFCVHKFTDGTIDQIRALMKRNFTGCIHNSLHQVEEEMDANPRFKDEVEELMQKIRVMIAAKM